MIRSLFIPDHIQSYYLFSTRIVAIEITRTGLVASVVILKGTSRTVEVTFQEPLSEGPFDTQVVEALKMLKQKIGSVSKVYCLVPSSQVIFKDLTLPFTGSKKIKMVIPFEIESQLPFGLDEGVIDGIITGIHTTEERTDVLVAAAKQDLIARYESYFKEAGLQLDKLSIDIAELYGLFDLLKQDPEQVVALVTSSKTETTVGLIIDRRLTYVRTIGQGMSTEIDSQESHASLYDEIHLTIDTAVERFAPTRSLSKIVFIGDEIPSLRSYFIDHFTTPVEFLSAETLVSQGIISSKISHLSRDFTPTIALGIAPEKTENFSLLQAVAHQKEDRYITLQLVSIGIITATLLLSFSLYSFLRVRTLKRAYASAEKEAIGELKKQFKITVHQARRLDLANKAAQTELKKQETAWRRISPENRYLYLRYLAELTKCINMQESQLDLDSIMVKDDAIKLYGKVPGYQQLTKLQEQLECPLFKRLPKLQAFNFKSEPITLTVNSESL